MLDVTVSEENEKQFRLFCANTFVDLFFLRDRNLGAKKDDVKNAIQALLQTDQTTLYLRINGTKMDIFPDFFFDGLPVENLEAKFCDLNEISDSAFFGLSRTLKALDLSENLLTRVSHFTRICICFSYLKGKCI